MTEEISKTFSTPEGCDLVVKNIQGTISVEGWDRLDTEIRAVRHQDWIEVEIHQEGRQVVAETKDERGPMGVLGWFGRGRSPTVDYAVRVPYASNLKLRNVNGPMRVTRIQGHVCTSNVDGPTTLEGVNGEVESETVNGPIHAVRLVGEARLKAVNGRLVVEQSRLGELASEAVNGQIEVTTTLHPGGKYTFNTVNGSCHLTIPDDSRARVSASGVNSGVDCDLPTQGVERSFGNWRGVIGQGDGPMAEISLHTVNGRLHIEGSGTSAEESTPFVAKAEAQAVPRTPEPSQSPATPESPEAVVVKVTADSGSEETKARRPSSKAEVLEMIERGEVGVEEALALLKELD